MRLKVRLMMTAARKRQTTTLASSGSVTGS
jgi:hypothetical protein